MDQLWTADQFQGATNTKFQLQTNMEEENATQFEPVVHLVPVTTDNGESCETEIYKQRCILYRFVNATSTDPAQWKERGRGDIRFLQHRDHKNIRLILRE